MLSQTNVNIKIHLLFAFPNKPLILYPPNNYTSQIAMQWTTSPQADEVSKRNLFLFAASGGEFTQSD